MTTDVDEQSKSDEKPVTPKKEIKHLQIGIKKKVPDCVRRSKANDVLHIHYEVGVQWKLFISNLEILSGQS